MIVRDLHERTDDHLLAMLKEIDNEPVHWTPVVIAELTRRGVLRVERLSRRLEKLTIALILLTVVLAIFAAPPALEVLQRWTQGEKRHATAHE